jgi:hypothetical protein
MGVIIGIFKDVGIPDASSRASRFMSGNITAYYGSSQDLANAIWDSLRMRK